MRNNVLRKNPFVPVVSNEMHEKFNQTGNKKQPSSRNFVFLIVSYEYVLNFIMTASDCMLILIEN